MKKQCRKFLYYVKMGLKLFTSGNQNLTRNSKPFYTLCVYYGNDKRWNQELLNIIQQKLGRECNGLDGLQADFKYASYDEAIAALFIIRGMNIRAQVGDIGNQPSKRALDEAQRVMIESYRTENE